MAVLSEALGGYALAFALAALLCVAGAYASWRVR
jgi:hypothetical protein